jgi:uncharacterized membrane protein YfcA
LIPGGVGIAIGTYALARIPSELLSLALGMVVVVYVAMRVAQPGLRLNMCVGKKIAPAVGLVAGTFHGATGISAPIGVTYLHAMPLSRAAYLLSISLMFLVFSGVQIPVMAANGILTWPRFLESVLALLPVVLGMALGSVVGGYMNARMFDVAVLLLLIAAAGPLLFEGIYFLLS